jgi:predicted Rossmann fold flavoprotein
MVETMKNIKVVVIGAGASGIACSIKLKQLHPQAEVILLEKNDKIAKKILKTGNGKCNIGNLDMKSSYYNNEDLLEKCFERFSVSDLVSFFKEIGLLIKPDSAMRLYPFSETATSVVEVLKYEIEKLGIDLRLNVEVESVSSGDTFVVNTNDGVIKANVLIMATGSIAQEKTNGYQILKSLRHSVSELRPGLVPIKIKENLKPVQGIRVKCLARVLEDKKIVHQEVGEILFKDSGLSGILSLNLSRYTKIGSIVSLDLFYDRPEIIDEINELLKKKSLLDVLIGILPKTLALELIKNNSSLINNLERIRDLRFTVKDYYSYDLAQITIGGISTSEINNDFSSIYNPNLYIVGEVLDIDGSSGGYNLHFAWMSGILAALSINERF